MSEKSEIARRLRTARELSGLSQGQAAKRLNMHRPTISEIEAGRRNVRASEIALFGDLYGVDVAWIMDGESERPNTSDSILAAARELSSMSDSDLETLLNTIRMIKSKGNTVE
ncbi:helix-turn-helix transcriptional regulator [Zhongshania borealis]|uniref:HTH cro/C1-type domain-containing protein n=1 Tax=Zhongshania borealis TaxID=889488 RepID=A0ABP7WRP3_9GAMM